MDVNPNTLWDPQIVLLTLGVIGVQFMYVRKVPHDAGCIFMRGEIKKDIKNELNNWAILKWDHK